MSSPERPAFPRPASTPAPPAPPSGGGPSTPKIVAIVLVVLAVLAGGAWATGALDKTLVDVGLNKETCSKNLFGNVMCGDELVEFCLDRYDPEINGDVCETVLRDAGEDPEAAARRVEFDEAQRMREIEEDLEADAQREEREEEERLEEQRAAARDEAAIGDATELGGLTLTVDQLGPAELVEGAYTDVTADRGRQLFVAQVTYRNAGSSPSGYLCSVTAGDQGFMLVDNQGREFTPDGEKTLEAAANEEACGGELQPGEGDDAWIVFEVPASVDPVELIAWNPDEPGPADGGAHVAIPFARS
jgi:hypothetical protein